MLDRDQWQEIWAVLGRNRLRTALTAFGVFWGIFMLVIMMGAGKGLENGATQEMDGWTTNSMFLWSQGTSKPYKGFRKGRYFTLRNNDIDALKDQVPEIDLISPRNQLGGWRGANNVIRKQKTGAFDLYGDYPEYNQIEKVKLLQGRLLNYGDMYDERKVAIIGKVVYETLFERGEDPIGEYIQVQGVGFRVVGLFKSLGSDPNRGEEQERSIYVPFTTFQKAFHLGDQVGWMAITSKDNIPVSFVEEKVKTVLKERHSVHPDDERAFGSWNLEANFSRMTGLFNGIRWLSLIVGTLTLIAGAIGVSNIMLVIVKERTKELGIRRAIGASPWTVIKQIILESLVLTSIAGIIGVVFGVWLLELISNYLPQAEGQTSFFKNPGVELPLVMAALGILVFSGIMAGIIPAKRAIEVKPVEALRVEG